MKITLIRHTSTDVPRGVCYGQTDVPLKKSFEDEAAVTYSHLKDTVFDKVYTSPLSRCTKLADYCGYTDAERDDRLMEMNFGEWEMKSYDEIDDPNLQAYYDDYLHTPATGGESFEMQLSRVTAFFDELLEKKYERVAIFTHGGVISCALIYAKVYSIQEVFYHGARYGECIEIMV